MSIKSCLLVSLMLLPPDEPHISTITESTTLTQPRKQMKTERKYNFCTTKKRAVRANAQRARKGLRVLTRNGLSTLARKPLLVLSRQPQFVGESEKSELSNVLVKAKQALGLLSVGLSYLFCFDSNWLACDQQSVRYYSNLQESTRILASLSCCQDQTCFAFESE